MRISIALFLILSIMQTAHAATTFDPDDYSTYCRAQNSEAECTELSYCEWDPPSEWDESDTGSCTNKTCHPHNESVNCDAGTYYIPYKGCDTCPAGYGIYYHTLDIYTDTNDPCLPHDECRKCTGNTIANKDHPDCYDCGPLHVANAEHTECTPCDPGELSTEGEDGKFTCKKCPPGQIAYEGSCKSCGAFGTPNDAQTECVCWVNMDGYKELCNPYYGYIKYEIVFNNDPAISDDKTDVVEVEYKPTYTGSDTYETSVENYPDRGDSYTDKVQIYTNDVAGQKPTANGYLFKGWHDKNNPDIIIEDTLTAENAHKILNPSEMTEHDKVQYFMEDGEPWEQYGKELTAIWEKCPAGSYCPPGEEDPQPCPAGTTSELNSKTINDCYIKGGKSRICDGSTCFVIPTDEKYNINIKTQ